MGRSKRWSLLCGIFLALPMFGHAQLISKQSTARSYSDAYDKSWALVIGIDAYQNADKLNYAVADAQAVAALLPTLGFPRENTFVLLNGEATKLRIETTLYRELRRMGPNDRLFVYFAGHGQTSPIRAGEEGYILAVDADPGNLALTAIAMDDIRKIGQRLPAKHYLFVMDACFSGFAITRATVPKHATSDYFLNALREPVVEIITAGRKGEQSIEDSGHGLFTRRVLDGLRGLADAEGRGVISAIQLAWWVQDRVNRDSKGRMTPQYSRLDGEGQFLFFMKSGANRPAAADLTGSFTGMIEGVINQTPFRMPVNVTFIQRTKNLSGTWTTASGSSGTLTGIVDGVSVRVFKVDQANPCHATFHGSASAESGGNTLRGSYAGADCNGTVAASFHVTRLDREERLDDSALDIPDLINIGVSYSSQQRYDDAIDYFQQARALAEKKSDEKGQLAALAGIGIARGAQGQDDEALRSLRRGEELATQLGDTNNQIFILNQIGLLHFSRKRYSEAHREYQKSLLLAQQMADEGQQARILYGLGLIALEERRRSDAVSLFDRAQQLSGSLSPLEREEIRQKRDEARGNAKK